MFYSVVSGTRTAFTQLSLFKPTLWYLQAFQPLPDKGIALGCGSQRLPLKNTIDDPCMIRMTRVCYSLYAHFHDASLNLSALPIINISLNHPSKCAHTLAYLHDQDEKLPT